MTEDKVGQEISRRERERETTGADSGLNYGGCHSRGEGGTSPVALIKGIRCLILAAFTAVKSGINQQLTCDLGICICRSEQSRSRSRSRGH